MRARVHAGADARGEGPEEGVQVEGHRGLRRGRFCWGIPRLIARIIVHAAVA